MIRESEPAEEGAVLIRFGNPPPLHDFCSELSCKTLEGLDGLRQLIFHITCNMKDVGSSICSQKLAGRLVRTVLSSSEPSQRWASWGVGLGLGGEFLELLLPQEVCEVYRIALEKAITSRSL